MPHTLLAQAQARLHQSSLEAARKRFEAQYAAVPPARLRQLRANLACAVASSAASLVSPQPGLSELQRRKHSRNHDLLVTELTALDQALAASFIPAIG